MTPDTKLGENTKVKIGPKLLNTATYNEPGSFWASAPVFCIQYKTGIKIKDTTSGTLWDIITVDGTTGTATSKRKGTSYTNAINKKLFNILTASTSSNDDIEKMKFKRAKQIALWQLIYNDGLAKNWVDNSFMDRWFLTQSKPFGSTAAEKNQITKLKSYITQIKNNNPYIKTGTSGIKEISIDTPNQEQLRGMKITDENTKDEDIKSKYSYIVGPFYFNIPDVTLTGKYVSINGGDYTSERFAMYDENDGITLGADLGTQIKNNIKPHAYILLTKDEYNNSNYTLKIKCDEQVEAYSSKMVIWLFKRDANQNCLAYKLNESTDTTTLPFTINIKSVGYDTGRLIINKVDSKTGESLAGAKFKVYTRDSESNKKYICYDSDGNIAYTQNEDEAKEFETDKNGQIIIENFIIEGNENYKQYIAEEVEAPNNYIGTSNVTIQVNRDQDNVYTVLKEMANDTGFLTNGEGDSKEFVSKTYQAIIQYDDDVKNDLEKVMNDKDRGKYWIDAIDNNTLSREEAFYKILNYSKYNVSTHYTDYESIKAYLNKAYQIFSGKSDDSPYIDYYMGVMYNSNSDEIFTQIVKEVVEESGLIENCKKIPDTETTAVTKIDETANTIQKGVRYKTKYYAFIEALYKYITPYTIDNPDSIQKIMGKTTRGAGYLDDMEANIKGYDDSLNLFLLYTSKTIAKEYGNENDIKNYLTNIYDNCSKINSSENKSIDETKLEEWAQKALNSITGVYVPNEHSVNMILEKVDADDVNKKLSGVGFKVKYIISETEQEYVTINSEGIAEYEPIETIIEDEGETNLKTKQEATEDPYILYTNKDGKIIINGAKEGKYQITEVYIPEEYSGLYDGKIENINDNYGNNNIYDKIYNVTRDGNNEFKLTITNKKQTIDLSGFVWVDKYSSKKSIRNDYYKLSNNEYEDDKDELKAGVNVYLKDKNGNIVNNAEGTPCKTTTNDNGEYKFEKILRDKLADYHVEFEYDGLTYTNVTMNLTDKENVAKTSKAQESEADRNNFNSEFAEITGTENGDLTKGYAKDSNGTVKHNLTYNIENHVATLSNIDGNINIAAKTQDSYIAERYKDMGENVSEITYINLGLYEREQPDIAIMKDLQNVKLSINGYNHVYNYSSRFNNAGEYGGEGFNVGVKFGNKYGNMTYTQSIYRSDYDYRNEKDTSKELKVNVTYKIAMKNESTNLVAQVNSLVDYFDSKYNLIAVGTELDNNGNVVGNKVNEATYNSDYKKTVIETNTKIEPQKMESIYVQFELGKEATLNILNDKGNLDNVVEINSYSVFDTNGKIYAGIDKDSAPGNCVPGNTDTYEDDTDKAPALLLEVQDGVARKLSGTVFEDNADETKLQAKYREGDGIYTEGNEHGIQGVKVKLISLTQDRSYEATTDSSGNFTIEGFIPDKYKVIYIWGGQTYQDTTYDVNNYKATIYNDGASSGENWWLNEEPRYSDAKDDYNLRTAIDNGTNTEGIMNSITAEMDFGIHKGDTQITTNITTVDGDKFVIGEYETKNIDFGIIERPRQGLDMEKRVSHIKLTYANGTVAIDADVSKDGKIGVVDENGNIVKEETIKGMIYTPNQIKIEMDSELIQGSKLEVTYAIVVKNTSEYDYMNENFYTYGNSIGDTTNPVTISATGVNDYLDKEFAYDEKVNSDWEIIREDSSTSKQEIINTIPSTEWEQDGETITKPDGTKIIRYKKSLGGTETTTETTWKYTIQSAKQSELSDETILKLKEEAKEQFKDIEPGQSKSVQLTTSKLLANSEEIELENKAEITQIDVKNGREPAIENTFDNAENIIVIPPTGSNKDYILPIVLGTSLLAIIGVGVVLIKKKVLNK